VTDGLANGNPPGTIPTHQQCLQTSRHAVLAALLMSDSASIAHENCFPLHFYISVL
jgi:hypothetical protein